MERPKFVSGVHYLLLLILIVKITVLLNTGFVIFAAYGQSSW
jgi:hypothetical protein